MPDATPRRQPSRKFESGEHEGGSIVIRGRHAVEPPVKLLLKGTESNVEKGGGTGWGQHRV